MFFPDHCTSKDFEVKISKLAARVVALGLETPCLLFLELHLPLANIGAHITFIVQPALNPLFGIERMKNFTRLLSSPKDLAFFMERIRILSEERDRRESIPQHQSTS